MDYAWFELSVRFSWLRQNIFRKYWDHSLVFQASIKFLEELNYVLMSKMPSPPLHMDSWTKCLEAYIFLSFLRKFKILLPFLFEVFWIDNIMYIFDYVKMNSVVKMNFLLNIDWPLTQSSISRIVICNTLMENWDHTIFPSLSILFYFHMSSPICCNPSLL